MDSLDKIRKKQRSLDKTTHNLLEKAVPSKEMPEKKWKLEENSDKKKKHKINHLETTKMQTFW